jgi:hypothetical protein
MCPMTSEPDSDPELDRQRAIIEAAFRDRWVPLDVTKPRILTGHVYAEARRFIAERGRTWVDGVIVQAVRDGAQPGDELPPLRPEPYLGRIADAKVTLIGRDQGRRVAVLFPMEDFPGAQFGHRFEPDPLAGNGQALQLMQQMEAGAVHRMMASHPSSDRGILWTTWGTPSTDLELETQRAQIHAAFRDGWAPHGVDEPRVLTGPAYAEVRRLLDRGGGWTGWDRATIDAVRNGAQPGDSLPPLRRRPFIENLTDTEVLLNGIGPSRRVAVLFSHTHFPDLRFGHRFPLEPYAKDYESIWLMEEIDTGALHRMMKKQPAADSTGIIWTAWGIPAR